MKTTTWAGLALWAIGAWWMLLVVSAFVYLVTGHSYGVSSATSFVTLVLMTVSSAICFWGGYLLLKGRQ